MHKPRIVFVGGIGGSGKSTFADDICKALSMDVYRLDAVHQSISALGSKDADDPFVSTLSRGLSLSILQHVVSAGRRLVIEGAWIRPREIQIMTPNPYFTGIFLGYPHTTPRERLNYLKKSNSSHWICKMDERRAISKLKEHIIYCQHELKVCEALGLAFIDTSDFDSDEFSQKQSDTIRNLTQEKT